MTKPYLAGSSVDLVEFVVKPRERLAWFLEGIGRRYRASSLSTFQTWLDRHVCEVLDRIAERSVDTIVTHWDADLHHDHEPRTGPSFWI